MAHYLTDADITNRVVKIAIANAQNPSAAWHTQVDEEIVSIAAAFGISSTSISTTLNPKVRAYARDFFVMIVCRDLMRTNLGTNENVQSDDTDQYKQTYDTYQNIVASARQDLQRWMFLYEGEYYGQENHVRNTIIFPG